MYYAKAVNCCNDVRAVLNSGPDGGDCPPTGSCRGFDGNCADLPAQFATVAVLPDYPNGLQDYVCHAFPDDDKPVDSFIVGLISIAIAIPVTQFLASCFAIANDSEAPESWLQWRGWRKFVLGLQAHRLWHYTGRLGQPMRYVRWWARSSSDAPPVETLQNAWLRLVAALTCRSAGTSTCRPMLPVDKCRSTCRHLLQKPSGDKRRARAVSGEVGYAIAGLWVRYPVS